MRLILATLTACVLCLSPQASRSAQAQAGQRSSLRLVNRDILEMQAAGLSSEIIAEKIKTSQCDFDTTPGALAELKRAMVPEPVILLIMRCPSAPETGRAYEYTNGGRRPVYRGLAVLPVDSYQVLSFGNRNKPYGDILRLIDGKLVEEVRARGIQQAAVQDGECCRMRIELLQATYDLDARRGATSRLVVKVSVPGSGYLRTFQGDAPRKRPGARFETRLNEAAARLVKAIVADDNLMMLLAGSKQYSASIRP